MDKPSEHSDKFENFEFQPREELWNQIQEQAPANPPGGLKPKFEPFTHAPRSAVWNNIEASLYPQRRRRRAFVWWAAAASIALLVGVALFRDFPTAPQPDNSYASQLPTGTPDSPVKGQLAPELSPMANRQTGTKVPTLHPESPDLIEGHGPSVDQRGGHREGLRGPGRAPQLQPGLAPAPQKVLAPDPTPGLPLRDFAGLQPRNLGGLGLQHEAVLGRRDPADLEGVAIAIEKTPLEFRFEKFDEPVEESAWGLTAMLASNGSLGTGKQEDLTEDYTSNFSGFSAPSPLTVSETIDAYQLESYRTPLVLGLRVNKKLGKRLSIESGPVYTLLTSTAKYSNNAWLTTEKIKREYLGLSLSTNCDLIQRKRLSLYASTGIQYDLGLKRKVESLDLFYGNQTESYHSTKLGNQASANLGIGANFKLNQRMALYFQSSATHYFHLRNFNLWSEKKVWLNAQLGLRLHL